MTTGPMTIVILGLSITSSWGNGHATTYRGLVRELRARGHDVLFLERDVEWYAGNRDMPQPAFARLGLYTSLAELHDAYAAEIRRADCVIVGSYVPEGIAVGEWVAREAGGLTAFYDIDTPITVAALERGDCEYLSAALVPQYDLYLSFTGGPMLEQIERAHGSPCARPLYCSFDPECYFPEAAAPRWDLGYMGTYSEDRQPGLERLCLDAARQSPETRVVVAGPGYPASIAWPANADRIAHLPPPEHQRFYTSLRFALNLTRADMARAGYSPSIRLFEAAGCGTAIITDDWPGLSSFFMPGVEVVVARTTADTLGYLHDLPDDERAAVGARGLARVRAEHTAAHRAEELEGYLLEARRDARTR
jgi:spore maturation protein CgeB